MMTAAFRYVTRHPGRALQALAQNPLSVWDTMYDRMVQNREYKRAPYSPKSDPDWQQRLTDRLLFDANAALGEFDLLWPQVIAELEARHVPTGPISFNGYNDGDKGFVRAVWLMVRGLRPGHVVETGVAHGMTSRFILEAMDRNGLGNLWSIDRPPLDPAMRAQVGAAVGTPHPYRWKLIAGTSRRCLPGLLTSLGRIDLFIHDSLHTERNVRFELDRAWEMLRPGGAMVVDDIDSNWGFDAFVKSQDGFEAIVCEAEPIRSDSRRFNGKGLFGIILKDAD